MKNIIVSFSGGRTSAFMCKLLLESPLYSDYSKLFVFANTGKEREETLEFVDRCDKEFGLNLVWLEADVNPIKGKGTDYRIVDFNTASRNGEPFEAVIRKYGLPSMKYQHCTRELKINPIKKYSQTIFTDYHTAIGIRSDEKHRLRINTKNIYPVNDFNIDEKVIREFWDRQTFDLKLKDYQGNCDLCFKKSLRKKLTLVKEDPESIDWWNKQEIRYGSEKQPRFDMRDNLSIEDLVKKSEKPFRMVMDSHDLRKLRPSLDLDLDYETDCFCNSGLTII